MSKVSGTEVSPVIGTREDLSDLISNISPTATPFITGAGVGAKVDDIRHDWQLDSLAAAATNAQEEGDEVTFTLPGATSRVGNIMQISTKSLVISATAERTRKAGRKSEKAYQIAKRAKELKRDQEKICIGTNQGASASDPRKSATMLSYTRTNVIDGGGAAADPAAPASGLYAGTRTAGDAQSFTEDLLKSALTELYNAGGEVDGAVLMVSPTQKGVVSTFPGIAQPMTNTKGAATIVAAVSVYVSDFGDITVTPNRFQRNADAWILDFELLRLRYLRPYKVEDLAKTGDADKSFMVCEWGLQNDNEAGHALITDLS